MSLCPSSSWGAPGANEVPRCAVGRGGLQEIISEVSTPSCPLSLQRTQMIHVSINGTSLQSNNSVRPTVTPRDAYRSEELLEVKFRIALLSLEDYDRLPRKDAQE